MFKKYYQNVIDKHNKGFKLVLGGTGLGKTSGIIETIKQNPEPNKRFFYFANRLQLLNEMASDLENNSIGYCLQKRDDQIIIDISEAELVTLLDNELINKYAKNLFKNLRKESILSTFKFVKNNSQLGHFDDGAEIIRSRTNKIFYYFKSILRKASSNSKHYDTLRQLSTIQKFFPYIEFQEKKEEKRIFIVSLQKAFYGFFDGKRTVTLHYLQNDEDKKERNILFLDEFDFLEGDLLSQICKDTNIEQPFSFVEKFYNVLTKYKLPRANFLKNHPDLRAELMKEVIEPVNSLKKYQLPFPHINHFLCEDDKLKNTAIFQTRYSISNYAIHLNTNNKSKNNQRINSFYIEMATDEKRANAYALLNVVNQVTSSIIKIIKDLEVTEHEIANALIEHCFSTSDKYKSILKRIKQHPYKRQLVPTNISKVYYNGFGLFEIYNFHYPTDENEVELKYYSLFSTPESILLRLTKNNLVFGLSATARIERLVNNFDLTWLRKELGKLYFSVGDYEQGIIKEANQIKFLGSDNNEGRNNKVSVEIAKEDISDKLIRLIDNVVHNETEIFGEGNKQKYRTKRIRLFFNTLDWIVQADKGSSNLLFFTSYEPILHLFQKVQKPVRKQYLIETIEDSSLKNCYTIKYKETDFIILFLNAAQGKEIANFEKNQADYYGLFRQGKPVVLVTTYASAGNGVNLHYYTNEELTAKTDFKHIHLLDSPFYYFSTPTFDDTEQEKQEQIKSNIYHLSKLEKNKIISEKQFKIYLNNIRNADTINTLYLKTADALYNRVATYIQAIGRIERSWNKVDNQVIRLEREVYNTLEDFCKIDNGDDKRYRQKYLTNLPFYSSNVKQMFECILEQETDRKLKISHQQDEKLFDINNKCREALQSLVDKLELVRQNKLPTHKLQRIREEWQMLRKLALGHNSPDFEIQKEKREKLLRKYKCTFQTDCYDHINKSLWIQKDTLNIVPRSVQADSSFYEWQIDKIFSKVIQNPILSTHFDLKHFEYGFLGNNRFFTPYFYQSILAGAIGEEAVKAIFTREQIRITEDDINNTLFELMDLKIVDKPWYIDAKNYSEQTIQNFEIVDVEDYFYHPKLNSDYFKKRAINKWKQISNFHNDDNSKIIYVNIFGSDERPIIYYDEYFNAIGNDFNNAKIIIVPNVFKKSKADKGDDNYANGFQTLISYIKKQLNNE